MTTTYMQAIGLGFPGVECHAVGEGDVYENIVWDAGLPLPDKSTLEQWIASHPTMGVDRRITVLAFRNRFTKTEKITLELASIDDPNAAMGLRQLAAALRVDTKDVDNASYIDLDRADTRAGVLSLETYGLIGTGRALQILDNPILVSEVSLSPPY